MKTAKELEIPVRKWVPDIIGVITVFLIMMPIAMLNGTYTGSMVEVSNTLGVYTEDITIGYYAASAGMAVSYPIVPKILNAFSSKSLLLADLTLQLFLSWICARQSNIDLLITFSFIIGFLKGFIIAHNKSSNIMIDTVINHPACSLVHVVIYFIVTLAC